MKIRELIIDDVVDDELGVYAVSLVSNPAFETPFLYFNKEVKLGRRAKKAEEAGINLDDWWVYTAAPEAEIINTSHKFCKQKAGNIFHVSEIRGWSNLPQGLKDEYKFNNDSNFFSTFSPEIPNKNIDQQIFGCRHYLKRVSKIEDIPEYKLSLFRKEPKNQMFSQKILFKVSNKEKREIEGLALRSGQFIYRMDVDGEEGYVFFTRETVRKAQEKYGYNRTLTIEHSFNVTGHAILLDSWLNEDDNNGITEWYLKFKIINDELWELIKKEEIVGFSIEGLFSFKENISK